MEITERIAKAIGKASKNAGSNAALGRANREVQELLGRRDAARAAAKRETSALYDADEIRASLENMVAALVVGDNREHLRRAMKAWVRKIERRGDDIEITLHAGGAPKRLSWLRELDLDAPLFQVARHVVLRLVA